MPPVETVTGAIDTTELGTTLMHEHVFVLNPELMSNYPDAWGDEDLRVMDAVARLNDLSTRGVKTIVDLTVIGLGRYVPRIQRVAKQTPINIVAATGLFSSPPNSPSGSMRMVGASTSIMRAWLQPQCQRHTRVSIRVRVSVVARSRTASGVRAWSHSTSQSGCSESRANSSSAS